MTVWTIYLNTWSITTLTVRKNFLPLFQSLQNLHHLDLSRNMFDQLPIAVCQLKNLETLTLKYNKLLNLPTDTEALVNLKVQWSSK